MLLAVGLSSVAWADPGPPDPISLDRQSPSILDFFPGPIPGVPGIGHHTPGNIYDMPTIQTMPPALPMGLDAGVFPGPVVHVLDTNYGLTNLPNNEDNNDAHSNGEQIDLNPDDGIDPNTPDAPQILYFSGDDRSVGIGGTDYDNQAQLVQAAGDRFMVNGTTTISPRQSLATGLTSLISGPIMQGGANNFPTNLLSANQHRYHEIPSIGPAQMNTYVPHSPKATQMDDMDALELLPFDLTPGDQRLVHNTPIYFSLDPISPSLTNLPGYSAADILVSLPTMASFNLFAQDVSMGLNQQAWGDDVDALAVWDYEQLGVADPGIDVALFSLAPGSPFLSGPDFVPGTADDFSAADIFVTDFNGSNVVYLQFRTIGMRFEDNVDAIDVEPEWLLQEPLDFVSPLPLPPSADSDGDGDVDGRDFLAWQRGFNKLGPGLTLGDGDFNREDVIVDGVDLAVWLGQFGTPAVAVANGVPEPATGMLLGIGMLIVGACCRRRGWPVR
jgi:hypothetical protein